MSESARNALVERLRGAVLEVDDVHVVYTGERGRRNPYGASRSIPRRRPGYTTFGVLFIALLVLIVVGGVWAAHRNGYSFDGRGARVLAFLAAIFGLALATFLGVHAAATASDGVHRPGDVTWVVILAVVAGVAGAVLLAGTLLWRGGQAWSLRLAGFVGLLLATLGSMSWVLPFFAPVALLAVPSLAVDQRSSPGRRGVGTSRVDPWAS